MDGRIHEGAKMNSKRRVKHIYEGRYVAEVDVELLEDDTDWSPMPIGR